jgi:hypothetical protein
MFIIFFNIFHTFFHSCFHQRISFFFKKKIVLSAFMFIFTKNINTYYKCKMMNGTTINDDVCDYK